MEKKISLREFARMFLQILWDESEIADIKKAHIPTRAAAIAELLGRHFGFSTVHFLGSGAFGAAARTPDGKALKLTTDEHEVDAGVILAGKDVPHVARIEKAWMTPIKAYNGTEERDLPVGILVLEAFDQIGLPTFELRSELNTLVDEVAKMYQVYLWNLRDVPDGEIMKRLEGASKHLLGVLEASKHPEFQQMADGLRELHKIKLWAVDLHAQNVGFSDAEGVFKLFDLGFWPRQHRPLLQGRWR